MFDDGQIWIVTYGKITYEDIFGKSHFTEVCFINFHLAPNVYNSSPPGSTKCAEYEKTDD